MAAVRRHRGAGCVVAVAGHWRDCLAHRVAGGGDVSGCDPCRAAYRVGYNHLRKFCRQCGEWMEDPPAKPCTVCGEMSGRPDIFGRCSICQEMAGCYAEP